MKIFSRISVLLLLVLSSACTPKAHWQIVTAETAEISKGIIKGSSATGERGSILTNTFLLNSKTGETYVLWPAEAGYTWKELKH